MAAVKYPKSLIKLHTALSIGELYNTNSVIFKVLKAAVTSLILLLKASDPFNVLNKRPQLAALAAFFINCRTILKFFTFWVFRGLFFTTSNSNWPIREDATLSTNKKREGVKGPNKGVDKGAGKGVGKKVIL